MSFKTLENLEVQGKTVLLRIALDSPLSEGRVRDDFRIRAVVPTIEYLLALGAKVIILSKLKRPQREGKAWDKSYSLLPLVDKLGELLNKKVISITDEIDKLPDYNVPQIYFFTQNIQETDISGFVQQMNSKDIGVLENIRFYKGELDNSKDFAKRLASLGECYVNDAFADSHLHAEHASILSLPELLPHAAGLLVEKEIENLSKITMSPKKPFVVMMGGIKLSTKLHALKHLAKDADKVLLGGGLANILLRSQGFEVGKSKIEGGLESTSKQILRDYKGKLELPRDVVVSTGPDSPAECVALNKVRPHQMILDVGPKTIFEYSKVIRRAKTLVWNGPMGYFESKPFSHGTYALARLFASRARGKAFGVAGGGETLEVIRKEELADFIDHVSTGGGAMLDFLSGKALPGLEALK